MTHIDDQTRVQHMLDAARRANQLVQGRRRHDLDADDVLALALVRLLEIVGEAARGVSPDLQGRQPQIPWRQTVGLRNRLIHAYFNVDLDIVWQVATVELAQLVEQLEVLSRDEGWVVDPLGK